MRRLLPFVGIAVVAFALGWVVKGEPKRPTATPLAADYIVVARPDHTKPLGADSQRLTVLRTGHSFGARDSMEWVITLSGPAIEPGDPAAVFYCVPVTEAVTSPVTPK